MTRREVILLFWDCPYCGHKHIPGPTRRCPACFWWRDRTVNFYEAPDSVVLSPAEVARYAGPDWICKACGAANPETGAPRESLVCGNCHTRQIDIDGGRTPLETLPTGVAVEHQPSRWEVCSPRRYTGRAAPPMSGGIVREIGSDPQRSILAMVYALATVGLLGLGIVGLNTLGHLVSRPRPVNALVLRRHWRVEVPIEERRPVSEGGWTLPAGAYNVRTETRQQSTRRVQVGTKTETVKVPYEEKVGTRTECTTVSRGDGTGERVCSEEPIYETRYRTETEEVPIYREEPVYATWYSYTIDRWQPLRTAVVEGTENMPRRADTVELATHPYPQRKLSPKEICFLDVYAQNRRQTWRIVCEQYDWVVSEKQQMFLKRPGAKEVTLLRSQ
jgi:hypothetical protein